ncbi:MAG: PqqD family protein [Nostoc sp. ChiQUE01a]|nr:PqqD family protein [Nostoc sp. ChiQUE01a]
MIIHNHKAFLEKMTAQIVLNHKVSLSANVLTQDLAGESVLLNLQSEEYFSQNEVGTKMFFVLTESDSIQRAYDTLLTEYEVEPEKLKQDLFKFIEKLVEAGLVEITDS